MGRRFVSMAVVLALLMVVNTSSPATAQEGPVGFDFQGELEGRQDFDARAGQAAPSAAQRRTAATNGTVQWNRFGTPHTVTATGGFLAEGLPADAVEAARAYLLANQDLFGLGEDQVAALEVLRVAPIGAGHAVLLRQRFGDLSAGVDGLVTVAVVDGKVVHAWSSLTRDAALSGEVQLTASEAVSAAAQELGHDVATADVEVVETNDKWTVLEATELAQPAHARLVAVPTPLDGVRPAWATFIMSPEESEGAGQLIDAETGDLLVRTDLVDFFDPENPEWSIFPVSPPLDYSTNDTRELWCWEAGPDCDETVANAASPLEWDLDPVTGLPTNTSLGNNARGTEKWNEGGNISQGTNFATPSPTREYTYEWTNQWFEESCNPEVFTSPQRNDIDAAIANLFAGHNRMHDWAYNLGYTEVNFNNQQSNFGRGGRELDPEHGNAQAGGIIGGPPTYSARDNANQFWTPDGIAPTTNMFLWQVVPGSFYAPCVDGDYDMTVIGHEYTHIISNRMVGGPDDRLRDHQANAMGESWSDFVAMEHLHEFGLLPVGGENPWAVGPYVTGDPVQGIRNYGMNNSPLNYSDVGYDLTGPQVHADGEIWSATNFQLRQAFIARHGAGTAAVQEACARGEMPVNTCPGNRRWIQIVFDSFLLMPNRASMVDARNAMLAADLLRFNGENQDLMWNVFANRGLGQEASSQMAADTAPIPDFTSLHSPEGTYRFEPRDPDGNPIDAQLFVGRYEARARPVADTDPVTELDDVVSLVPGTYEFLARADGYGTQRFQFTVQANAFRGLRVVMRLNVASVHNGASVSGDGANLEELIDDTEATNWVASGAPVGGREVTVRLDPSRAVQPVSRVQVSAMLRPPNPDDPDDPAAQNRFTALRQFEILACTARGGVDCTDDADFTSVFVSASDAFPAVAPRPRAPDLIIRSFDIPRTQATHLKLRVLENQCTGTPAFRGDQDDDPRHDTDCVTGSGAVLGVSSGTIVRAAELQAFSR